MRLAKGFLLPIMRQKFSQFRSAYDIRQASAGRPQGDPGKSFSVQEINSGKKII